MRKYTSSLLGSASRTLCVLSTGGISLKCFTLCYILWDNAFLSHRPHSQEAHLHRAPLAVCGAFPRPSLCPAHRSFSNSFVQLECFFLAVLPVCLDSYPPCWPIPSCQALHVFCALTNRNPMTHFAALTYKQVPLTKSDLTPHDMHTCGLIVTLQKLQGDSRGLWFFFLMFCLCVCF